MLKTTRIVMQGSLACALLLLLCCTLAHAARPISVSHAAAESQSSDASSLAADKAEFLKQ